MFNKFYGLRMNKQMHNSCVALAKQRLLTRTPTSSNRPKTSVSMRFYSGFTLIELIVVIVILGILAATAMPKFTSMRREAKIASLNALAGAMRSSIVLVEGACQLQGLSPGATSPNGEFYGQHIITADNAWVEAFCSGSNGVPQMPSVPDLAGMITMMGCPMTESQLLSRSPPFSPMRPQPGSGFSCNGMTIYPMWMTVGETTNGEIADDRIYYIMTEWQIGNSDQPGCSVRYQPFYITPTDLYLPIVYVDTTDC